MANTPSAEAPAPTSREWVTSPVVEVAIVSRTTASAMNSPISAIRAQRLRRSTPIISSTSTAENKLAMPSAPWSGNSSMVSSTSAESSAPSRRASHCAITEPDCNSTSAAVNTTVGGGRW